MKKTIYSFNDSKCRRMALSCSKIHQTSKFRTKNWVEVNGDVRKTYNTNSQIKFKTSMLMSSLCDYSDVYILVSGTITNTGEEDTDPTKPADERNKKSII